MFLSVVIPAYNEEDRLGITLSRIHSYLNTKEYKYEVIVVDDGSSNNKTREIALASSLKSAGSLKLLSNRRNRGKGFSVRKGIIAANGEYILFSDADLSTPIQELDKLLEYTKTDYDIAIGSRSITGSDVRVHQPFCRETMGRVFNLIVQTLVIKGIVDTQCGFKLLKSNIAKEIAAKMQIDGFSFDVEMLYLAKRMGCKIREVPITWVNSPLSKVNPIKDSFKMFLDILYIKRLHK